MSRVVLLKAGALNTGSSVTFIDAFMLNWKSRATGENECAMESAEISLWSEEYHGNTESQSSQGPKSI